MFKVADKEYTWPVLEVPCSVTGLVAEAYVLQNVELSIKLDGWP